MKLFGFEITRSQDKEDLKAFSDPINDDGAINIDVGAFGGAYSYMLDLEGVTKSETDLITKYRSMAMQPEIFRAVDEIVNEAISIDFNEKVVEIVLDDTNLPDKVKDTIIKEFDEVLRLLDFSNNGYDIFFKWYVDGRINYHAIIDEDKPRRGIRELRYLDPRKIRLIRENEYETHEKIQNLLTKKVRKEYFIYTENGFGVNSGTNVFGGAATNTNVKGLKIAKDSIIRTTSGLVNENNTQILSHLHKSIKPLNQIRSLEDANVIYTLTRAPERRVFYVDVGTLPKHKAEQYMQDMMARHKNKLQYNSATGEITDSRRFMTMTEDFWFPRREGNRTTEIDTIGGAGSLSDNEQSQYFKKKLYESLNVPASRIDGEANYSFGRVSEITREELKFSKFIKRLRARFSILFDKILEKQLILKNVLTPKEWDEIKDLIRYDFMRDNYFDELKNLEILRERIQMLREVEDNVGKYFSKIWVQKNILYMNDDDIRLMKKEIDKEKENGEYDDGFGDEFGMDNDQQPSSPKPKPIEKEPEEPKKQEPESDDGFISIPNKKDDTEN